jgi:hypothetical protein
MQYVKEKAVFDFEVYFNDITKEQLNQLYTALCYGENTADGVLCHKIGHGKPIGFGSVKINVEKIIVRKFSVNNGTESYDIDHEWLSKVVPIILPPEVEIAADFNHIKGKKIDYPRIDDEIYKWFSKNRPINGAAKYKVKLPGLVDEEGKPKEVTLDENHTIVQNEKGRAKKESPADVNSLNSMDKAFQNIENSTTKTNNNAGKQDVRQPKEIVVTRAIQNVKMGIKNDFNKKILEKVTAFTDNNRGTKLDKYVKEINEIMKKW